MKIGLLGDVHANMGHMKYALHRFQREGVKTVLQVGDFGFLPGRYAAPYLKNTEELLAKLDMEIFVTLGNHEDYDAVEKIPVVDGIRTLSPHIHFYTRGYRWEMDKMTFVSLGGAPSVDRSSRKPHRTWWPQEMITEDDIAKTVGPGYADVMLAHDAPYVPEITRLISGNPRGFAWGDLEYAKVGRERIERAFRGVQPKIFVHGHYHFPVNVLYHQTHVVGLNKDQSNFSLGLIDTETRQACMLDTFSDYQAWINRKLTNDYNPYKLIP